MVNFIFNKIKNNKNKCTRKNSSSINSSLFLSLTKWSVPLLSLLLLFCFLFCFFGAITLFQELIQKSQIHPSLCFRAMVNTCFCVYQGVIGNILGFVFISSLSQLFRLHIFNYITGV